MLHTKVQGPRSFGSGEEGFWRVFTIYGRGGHLGYVTQMPRTNFCSPDPWRLHMKFGFDWFSGFGEEDHWKWWTDNGACLYYKLTNEPKGSGEPTISISVTAGRSYSTLRIQEMSRLMTKPTKWHVCPVTTPPSLIRIFAVCSIGS